MNSSRCRCDVTYSEVSEAAAAAGFYAVGTLPCAEVDAEAARRYARWLEHGYHGEMAYLERYGDIRVNPALLLEGARSLIVGVIPYYHTVDAMSPGARLFASYAHGTDYHTIVRQRLENVADVLRKRHGGNFRAMVDTAPLRERYWVRRAGVGFIGMNSQLIVPGAGSYFFIGSLLTTLEVEEGRPFAEIELASLERRCESCRRCVKMCPGEAIIDGERRLDARRCLSYLTIEYRGEFPDALRLGGHLYGCDECQKACPHNVSPTPLTVGELGLRPEIATLTPEAVRQMTQQQFSAIFRDSAVKRTKLAGLLRNVRHL